MMRQHLAVPKSKGELKVVMSVRQRLRRSRLAGFNWCDLWSNSIKILIVLLNKIRSCESILIIYTFIYVSIYIKE